MRQLQLRATAYEYFQNGDSEFTAFERLKSKFGPQCVDLLTFQKWHEKFKLSGPPSKVQTDALTYTQRLYLGKIVDVDRHWGGSSKFSIDGQHLIMFEEFRIFLVDLFHWKSIKLELNPSTPIITSGYYAGRIVAVFPLSTNSIIVIYLSNSSFHIGVAKLDLSNYQYEIKSSVSNRFFCNSSDIFGELENSNTESRVFLVSLRSRYNVGQYQTVTIGTDDEIQVSEPIVLPYISHIFYFNGHLYGYETRPQSNTINMNKLIRFSIATYEVVHLSISDEKNVDISSYRDFIGPTTVVGRMIYTMHLKKTKGKLFTLDLDTMERKATGLVFIDRFQNGNGLKIHSDGEKTLIVSTSNANDKWRKVYRLVVNQPDSLFDCAWLAILRRAEFDHQLLDYVESKLPNNSRFKSLFPRQ
ncbi:hypothetical protein M3Y98_00030000 [Aphelenchoides besseyi]|nr:hypothetical protein M3Y98_00030000 [Aphelenchoides besseyi]KAI6199339.1 hypothetical protein M3Y96_00616500 [Aphelenchoides besseyi]